MMDRRDGEGNEMMWAFVTSKPSPSDISLPTRLYFLILTILFHQLWIKQANLWAHESHFFIQTTIPSSPQVHTPSGSKRILQFWWLYHLHCPSHGSTAVLVLCIDQSVIVPEVLLLFSPLSIVNITLGSHYCLVLWYTVFLTIAGASKTWCFC